jgi:tRNA pseudouridine38-40 synthase
MIMIDITADGFLYKMVRNIIGTLLEVSRGRLDPEDLVKILKGKNRVLAGDTAKPHALTLMNVEY